MRYNRKNRLLYFGQSFYSVLGMVLIWRGIWHALDIIDDKFFGQDHFPTAVSGIIIGLFLLYLPDHDLKEIEKL
ncbi:MAG: hypothetical protein FJY91_02750 [Candidatus Harrisonbacteria bacterium]|nr:hypothetical protein [Candidatus Harrisonbacteria bacterium]